VIFKKRAGGYAGFRMLDGAGGPIDDKTVFSKKIVEVHLQAIGSMMRI